MRSEYATAEDFTKWEDHAHTLSNSQIRFIVADCQAAERNMRGWNPIKEGYYSDQACTYGMVLSRRIKESLS